MECASPHVCWRNKSRTFSKRSFVIVELVLFFVMIMIDSYFIRFICLLLLLFLSLIFLLKSLQLKLNSIEPLVYYEIYVTINSLSVFLWFSRFQFFSSWIGSRMIFLFWIANKSSSSIYSLFVCLFVCFCVIQRSRKKV